MGTNTRTYRRAGLSLLEVLVAAALLLIIAISLIPLFQRALASNLYGREATQASTGGVRVAIEELNQVPINHADVQLPGNANVRALPDRLLDTGPTLPDSGLQAHVGDERWVVVDDPDNPPALQGGSMWTRGTELRDYSYADIHEGTISVDGTTVTTVGDPELFDDPLNGGNAQAHLKEVRASMQTSREGHPLGAGQRLTMRTMRTY